MPILDAILLGLVQGLTEYLPVSSSGHLVIVPAFLRLADPSFAFDIVVQMGTLLGVVVYYARDLGLVTRDVVQGLAARRPLGTPGARFGWLVVVATIPASVVGLLFKDVFEAAFSSPKATLAFLFVTAFLLALAEAVQRKRASAGRTTDELKLSDALIVGCAQALALFPGISRSGATIAAGLIVGLSREGAARLSFVMSIPVMVGAGALATRDLAADPAALARDAVPIAIGTIVAAVSGYVVIKWFLAFVKRRSLLWFAGYCVIVGAAGLLLWDTVVVEPPPPAVETGP